MVYCWKMLETSFGIYMALDPEEYPERNDYAREGLEWALKKIAQNGITSAVMPELTGFQGDIIKHGKI